ncbi:hypothetical protein QNH46_11645 [Paenibacillus woosongensis]|uniref:Uncharacterized protein n=1 Tax=Paenibacillus woosongensis TaxID=307580 RepID=A0AA95IC79_9BACL|nr:hypothetical protein [Paenibacillus woosongensis]WHX51244.1 hypothetical protein QNH46_11645 [Paenibacillus woosongensis]
MKKLLSVLLAVLVVPLVISIPTSYAKSNIDEGYVTVKSIDGGATIEASIKSSDPNESVQAVIEEEPNNYSVNRTSDNGYITKSYKVTYYVPSSEQPSSRITPQSSQGGSKTEVGATARITVTYDKKGDLIDLQTVSGGWTPESSLYYITDREVIYRADSITAGKTEKKYPSSNSFTYYPNWGYVQYYPSTAYSGTGADSWATIRVNGMTAYYNIEVHVRI